MKKIIVSIICVLFATSTFAQFIGASTMSRSSIAKSGSTEIAKHEISIHAGVGFTFEDVVLGLSAGIKYKYTPFKNSNIRFLGEVGSEFVTNSDYYNPFSVLPILVGVNYEAKFSQNCSFFIDLGLGPNIPLSGTREEFVGSHYYYDYDCSEGNYYEISDYQIGFTFSPEIGFAYDKFMFSIKGSFSWNDYTILRRECEYYYSSGYYDYDRGLHYSSDEEFSAYLLFRLGYRF
ncbi:MAG: hypothetical protein ACI3Z6_03075 [Candidatus Onthomorpha sp.]